MTNGGWFSTTGRDPSVLLRMKEDYDGAEPTASSVSVLNLLALSHLVEDRRWADKIERTFRCSAPRLEQMGRAVPMMAAALSTYVAGLQQITIVRGNGEVSELEQAVMTRYLPFALTFSLTPDQQRELGAAIPIMGAMKPIGGASDRIRVPGFRVPPPVTSVMELKTS